MKEMMTHRVKRTISSLNRKKSSFHQRRDEERTWCQNVENWCVQLRK
jgi:hypothetical protein